MRHRFHTVKIMFVAAILVVSGGCVTTQGMRSAIADDLALTTAAAAQGIVAGLLNSALGMP